MGPVENIEKTSYLWLKIILENRISKNGVVIEVAPGYEPKIGSALFLFGFRGTLFVIEPDKKAASYLQTIYRQLLPKATILFVTKLMQDIECGIDIPYEVDALLASHPFDDMVISYLIKQESFFSEETKDKENVSGAIKKVYDTIKDKDYDHAVKNTVEEWKKFIQKLKPNYLIVSQYPSRTLTIKGLVKRQNSGYAVLDQLKSFYSGSLKIRNHTGAFDFKGDPRWWIVANKPRENFTYNLKEKPLAFGRLGKSIFVRQRVRGLQLPEYDVVFTDKKFFRNLKYKERICKAQDFAIFVADNNSSYISKKIRAYADRQEDKTDISLSGNKGSGRAVYFGNRINILGIGKTSLCTSTVPSHSTGGAEIMGIMRRVILSHWINYFTPRATCHPVIIALKQTRIHKWNSNPLPLALLVRVDDGNLDRPTHIEYLPDVPFNFEKTLLEYARIDAEYFAYRFMLGAWSSSNYSLNGKIIDLETASFVKYRGPYYTSSGKYHENFFGYEGGGLLKILYQLADVKKIAKNKIKRQFEEERQKHLGRCFLKLLGIADDKVIIFFSKYRHRVVLLAKQFENLSKKISNLDINLNLYAPIEQNKDPSLLDMSKLFRNLADLYKSSGAKRGAFNLVIRKCALPRNTLINIEKDVDSKNNHTKFFINNKVVVGRGQLNDFFSQTKFFISSLFKLIAILDSENCLGRKKDWKERLLKINQDLPPMFRLNMILKDLAEKYRVGEISPMVLDRKIERLCNLPFTPPASNGVIKIPHETGY